MERLKAHDALKLEYMSYFAKITDEREDARLKNLQENIKSLVTKEGWSMDKAFDVLGVSREDRTIVAKKFEREMA